MTDEEMDIEELKATLSVILHFSDIEAAFIDDFGNKFLLPIEMKRIIDAIIDKSYIPILAKQLYKERYRRINPGSDSIEQVVKQAVKEFAEELKEIAKGQGEIVYDIDIENLITELYGEEN